ncbi:MAG: hypothetical protein H5U16_03025 [Roseovarius sp.]|nr:hypothetical protein [Roseovarius sp.]
MTPNFALSLSFDAIGLLHRAADGEWRPVGEVALGVEDLPGALVALRARARTLAPGGMASKLIIPDEQIRYLDLPAAAFATRADHARAVADALDGATPYALEELAFDWTVAGGRLQVAAVARETLEEAESFARAHGFNPVCFVACPDPATYAGEPVFGTIPDKTAPASAPTAAAAPAAQAPGAPERQDTAAARIPAAPQAPIPTVAPPAPNRAGQTRPARSGRRRPGGAGLILVAALVLLMVGIAALAALFPQSGPGRLLRGPEPQIAVTPEIPELSGQAAREPEPEVAALPPALPHPETETPGKALTGIRTEAPAPPRAPRGDTLDSLYQTSIDPALNLGDAVALPAARLLVADAAPPRPAPPPQPGRGFALDARGLVAATPEGALTPGGVIVHAGPPPLRPGSIPQRAVAIPDLTPTPEALAASARLAGIRPRARPDDLDEKQERGALGGRSRSELAALRPRARPSTLAAAAPPPDAAAIDAALEEANEQAIAASLKPRLRPQTIEQRAARATPAPAPPQRAPDPEADDEPETTRSAAPRIPSSASIAQQATTRNAINLRQVNLIGVYGTPANRRALVRLANGRYHRVQVGDRIDGGRVSAIGDDELRYRKGSRDIVLRLPRG